MRLAPFNSKYQKSSIARMGDRMTAYRKFIGTPTKKNMMSTLQDCLHDIYAKRPADPLKALSLRLQDKIASRKSNKSKNFEESALGEVQRLSDENHRLRLLLGPQGMDIAEAMERMQFAASEDRAKILALDNAKDCLEREVVALKQQLAFANAATVEKDLQLAQFAQSLNRLYGVDATEAAVKIQSLRRGRAQRQRRPKDDVLYDDMSSDSSDSGSDSDDDNDLDADFSFEKTGASVSVGQRKNRNANYLKLDDLDNISGGDDGEGEVELDQNAIDTLLDEDDHEMDKLDEQLDQFLDGVDLDDAVSAAIKIQAISRGAQSRKDDDEDDDEDVAALEGYLSGLSADDVEKAVLKIQALARGRMARSQAYQVEAPKFGHIGPAPDVEDLEKFLADECDDEQVYRQASKIQARFRGRKARKRVNCRQQEEKAALQIQRVARGRKARHRQLNKEKDQEEFNPYEVPKFGKVGPDMEALEEFLADESDEKIHMQASKIQANFRGRKARRHVDRRRQEEKAAVQIQRVARGRKTRRRRLGNDKRGNYTKPREQAAKFENIGPGSSPSPDVQALEDFLADQSDEEVQMQATKIQASFRGKEARKHVRRRRLSTVNVVSKTYETKEILVGPDVQKLHVFLGDKDDKELHRAASKLQAIQRGRLSRREQAGSF